MDAMTDSKPVYVLAPRGVAAVPSGLVPGHDPIPLAHPDELRGRAPGVLLLPLAELPADQLLAALGTAADASSEAPWLIVLVDADPKGGVRARPVSLGWPAAPAELARWAEGEPAAAVFDLRHVLARVARSRHDLNNPLTSAMAETQLALMDSTEPPVRESLETIGQQLKRMRDMIAGLKAIRPPP
jgi:signal transduction histidine kinase